MTSTFSRLVPLYLFFTGILLSSTLIAQSQNDQINFISKSNGNSSWHPAMANAAGLNDVNGVEVFFKRIDCNGEEVLILKFSNTNPEDVLIEWADGVYSDEGKWIHNEMPNKSRELNLKGGKGIEGGCDKSSLAELRINVDQYLKNSERGLKYAPSYIDVTK